jgi:hypothetical protein
VPAVGLEAPAHILREGQGRVALDGDVVVVVDEVQLPQAQVTGQGRGLAGDPLHQVAVADESPDAMVDHGETGPVEAIG